MRTGITLTAGLMMGVARGAPAQSIIDMPPPPPAPPAVVITGESPVAPTASSSATGVVAAVSPAQTPSVGDVALARYARARSGTRNTYFNDASYWNNGVRVYTYPRYFPQFVWGPFWGGSWPWRCW